MEPMEKSLTILLILDNCWSMVLIVPFIDHNFEFVIT